MRRPGLLSVGAAVALLAPAAGHAQSREPYPGFDAYVGAAMKTWKVPGAAIAIVRNDSMIFAKGYGIREVGKPERVTERTMFAIGSASKAFTAAGVAILVDEKKVRWDAPAAAYLPGFQLYDPYATRELTVRDILSHRSGLARGDMLWYGSELDRDEILRRTRFLQPTWSFRAQFGYQNLMYLAAGQVIARVSDMRWDDFIDQRIFEPLGMTSSTTSISALAGMPDVAKPHAEIDDTVRAIPWRNIDNIAPAGSINSHVIDMAQWVRLQLGKGKFSGKQLIDDELVEEMHTPHTVVRLDGAWKRMNPSAHLMAYGLGWFLNDYEGRLVVHHGGNIDGMSALVALMPGEDIGMVILTNMNGSGLPTVLMRRAFDALLGTPPRDWSAELLRLRDRTLARAKETERKREAERVKGTRPSLPLSAYVGTYADSMYGEAKVRQENGRLVVEFGPSFVGEMEHWHFNTFRTRWRDPSLGRAWVNFTIGSNARVRQMEMENIADFRREEKADTTAGIR